MLNFLRDKINAAGGRGFIVGGYVRHEVMKKLYGDIFGPNNDIDLEVYGLTQEEFEARFLPDFPGTEMVGRVFGVYKFKVDGQEIQINLPTIRESCGPGHKDEKVVIVPDLDYREACRRRNFTVNAMMIDTNSGLRLDFFGGYEDCKGKMLRPTSKLFGQDPLRVLNGMKLAGIYGFKASSQLMALDCNLSSLPMERTWGEWWNWAYRSIVPANGMKYLLDMGLCPKMLFDLQGLPQDPIYHPEGDVWMHTMIAIDWASLVGIREQLEPEDRGVLVLAALCHDLGKLTTTEMVNGRWASPGHDKAGELLTHQFLSSIGCPLKMQDRIVELVGLHMAHVHNMKPKKLKSRLKYNSPEMWLNIVEADHSARPPLPVGVPQSAQDLYEAITQIPTEEIKPIVTGSHLMEWVGLKPGKELGHWKNRLYEAQLEDRFASIEGGKDLLMFLWDEANEGKSK
jgi:tRNA nucleotidyltransferase (CCA-adding enzyme)